MHDKLALIYLRINSLKRLKALKRLTIDFHSLIYSKFVTITIE